MGLIVLAVNLVPSKPARGAGRWRGRCRAPFLRLAGIPLRVEGSERLPQAPCVVVANHASYIDGIVAAAALPPDFAFVIKKEMVRVPLAEPAAAAAGLGIRRALRPAQGRRRTRAGCGSSPPPASRWCSFRRAPSIRSPPGRQVSRRCICDGRARRNAGGGDGDSRHARGPADREDHGSTAVPIRVEILRSAERRATPGSAAAKLIARAAGRAARALRPRRLRNRR